MIFISKFDLGILIDTNAIISSIKFHIDLFYELKRLGYINFFIVNSVINELNKIILKGGSDKKNAIIGLKIAKLSCNIIDGNGYTDDLIIEYAIKFKLDVFTNDKILKNRLAKNKIAVIYIKNKKILEKKI